MVAKDEAEILLYDVIGDDWYGVTAKQMVADINGLDVSKITVRINSPGGEVFDAVAIYNALVEHRAIIETRVDALAASAASLILLAGEERIISDNSMVMIHNPNGFAWGDSEEIRRYADLLDSIKGTLLKTYSSRTGQLEDDLSIMMDNETWFNADEALEKGFATSKSEALKVAACLDPRIKYRNAPPSLKRKPKAKKKKMSEAEKKRLNEISFNMKRMESLTT